MGALILAGAGSANSRTPTINLVNPPPDNTDGTGGTPYLRNLSLTQGGVKTHEYS